MRVLLTLPPDIHTLEIYKITGMKAPPLGLAYIAAVLERAGHKVKIIDTPTLEMSTEQWLSEVKSWKPDIIGFSLITPTAPRGYRAIKLVREELPDVPVIVGGIHPTFMFKEALENGADIVVRGEGEYTAAELIDVLERYGFDEERLKKVRGIAFKSKRSEKIVLTPERPPPDLDELPWPARHLLPMDKYTLFGKPIRIIHVMASRGCPYGCMYCSTSYFFGRRVRIRSAIRVADEIEEAVYKYKAKHVVFADDDIGVGRKFMTDLVAEFKKRGLDLTFACGSRVDHMTKEYMKFLYDNGCVALYFGVESASQETLNRIGKKITIEQVERVFQWKKELGGFATASFILGFPWETIDDMKKTVEFAIKIDPDYAQFTALTPYPGTPLYQYAKKYNLIEDTNWEHYTTVRAVMRGFHFTRQQLQSMIKYAYRRFYLRPAFVWRELRAGRLKDLVGVLGREFFSMVKDFVVHPLKWKR
ncbi:radical SAM protein [Pyrofollis japonicus]|uniref:B12-binding domain-containing radical SAM protein n=1 Tax=Pyrofollis japonicus TaxID=3060460 RepID=UPI00295BC979|nr:radical SAM protein [Pyrofollis japonicus]BEP17769.1 radical SAM protein [Pyrofollis japonicus]